MSYGIEVYDTDGTTKVLDNSMRYINRMTDDVTLSGASSHTFNFDATGLSTSNCAVLIDGFQFNNRYSVAYNGTSGITITPVSPQTTLNGTYFVIRF